MRTRLGAGAAGGSPSQSLQGFCVWAQLGRSLLAAPGSAHTLLPSPVLSSSRAHCWISLPWFLLHFSDSQWNHIPGLIFCYFFIFHLGKGQLSLYDPTWLWDVSPGKRTNCRADPCVCSPEISLFNAQGDALGFHFYIVQILYSFRV